MADYRIHQWEPAFGHEEEEAVASAVASGWVTEHRLTREFEARFAAYVGSRFCQATNNGTVAIALALMSLEIGPGDEVLVPDLTFVATANAVKLAGATPVLVDIRRDNNGIDPDAAAQAITPRTAALLPVHFNGRSADMVALRALAKRKSLAVVEDAAQALGSRLDGRHLGTSGEVGCFSFATTKLITTAQGGMLVSDREDLYLKIVRLKDQGRLERSWNYHPALGFNFKFTDLQAALGLAQMDRLEERLAHKRRMYGRYRERLQHVPGLTMGNFGDTGEVPWFIDVYCDHRDELAASLREAGIETREFYRPLHREESCRCSGEFPIADDVSARGLWLPSSPGLTNAQIDDVCDAIERFFEQTRSRSPAPAVPG